MGLEQACAEKVNVIFVDHSFQIWADFSKTFITP
jgi:hypothetical protein